MIFALCRCNPGYIGIGRRLKPQQKQKQMKQMNTNTNTTPDSTTFAGFMTLSKEAALITIRFAGMCYGRPVSLDFTPHGFRFKEVDGYWTGPVLALDTPVEWSGAVCTVWEGGVKYRLLLHHNYTGYAEAIYLADAAERLSAELGLAFDRAVANSPASIAGVISGLEWEVYEPLHRLANTLEATAERVRYITPFGVVDPSGWPV